MAGDTCHFKQKQQKQNKIKKGLWSPEEDEKLFTYIIKFGVGSWSSVPHLVGLQRCGKSCRLRWMNYLRPGLKRGSFSQQEEDIILHLHQLIGNRWAKIASKLPGRTDNEIKNFWNSRLKKKLIKQGFDPNTHRPIHVPDDKRNKNIIPSAMIVELQEAFHMNNNGRLTLGDSFMKSNLFLDESEMGIDQMGFGCNLFSQHQQINCETSSPSFDFSDTLASRTMMDTFIKEESRESSSCTYSNMNNLTAEICKYEEWNEIKWQELQKVQASNAGDSDTYPMGLISGNLLGAFFTN